MIPQLTPIGRSPVQLNREYWHATEQFALAVTSGNVAEMKRWSKRLGELEAERA